MSLRYQLGQNIYYVNSFHESRIPNSYNNFRSPRATQLIFMSDCVYNTVSKSCLKNRYISPGIASVLFSCGVEIYSPNQCITSTRLDYYCALVKRLRNRPYKIF